MLNKKEWWSGMRPGSGNEEEGVSLTDIPKVDLMGCGAQKYRAKEKKESRPNQVNGDTLNTKRGNAEVGRNGG